MICKMRFAKRLSAAAFIAALPFGAPAQTPDLARTQDVSERYNECVYLSAVEHISPANTDISLAAEDAFKSCTTEQDQLIMLMQQIGMSPQQIAAGLLEKKTGIKRELRKMVLDSKGLK